MDLAGAERRRRRWVGRLGTALGGGGGGESEGGEIFWLLGTFSFGCGDIGKKPFSEAHNRWTGCPTLKTLATAKYGFVIAVLAGIDQLVLRAAAVLHPHWSSKLSQKCC